MLIHETGPGHIWTGNSREIGEAEAIPRKWHPGDLPVLASGEYAKWMGGSWGVTTVAVPPITKAELSAELAAYRYEQEVGGVSLPNGMEVRTDRETRASITEAVNALEAGLMIAPIPWKLATGWADLTHNDLKGIAAAVAAHVQACFAAERAVQVQIDAAGDLTAFDVPAAFTAAL